MSRSWERCVIIVWYGAEIVYYTNIVFTTIIIRLDLYAEYQNIRGTVALAKETLLPIQSNGTAQPCAVFGLHSSLNLLKNLYDEGTALFLANIGVLDRPVSNQNYLQLTAAQLFAHDASKL